MKNSNELMLMIAKFLYGEYTAEAFSFDFPAALSARYAALQAENNSLCAYLEEELPELCAAFDPYGSGEEGTLNAEQFRAVVFAVYQKALPLSMRSA